MNISHTKRFIFLHNRKTGSSSVGSILHRFCDNKHDKHMKIWDVANLYAKEWTEYFVFACVRNPWDRIVSCWRYDMENTYQFRKKQLSLERYMEFRKQFKWLWQQDMWTCLNGEVVLDFVMRFERLDEDFGIACKYIKIPARPLPRRRATKHKPYQEYYTKALREIVQKRCAFEIEKFGYTFGDGS